MSADKQTRNRNSRSSHSDFQRLSRRFMSGLLRSLFLINQTTRRTQAGFVLPTTVLLLLMVTLTTAALSFRSFSRTQAVIAQREQEVIVGAATPAIDRAKAKIEYLFAKDIRFPGGLPTSNKLQAMMRNTENSEPGGSNNSPIPGTDENSPPYTLKDEFRLDLNDDGKLDNAWYFSTDIDGNGIIDPARERIVYSILMDDAQRFPSNSTDPNDIRDIDDPVNQNKANALVNRNAPIDTATTGNACPAIGGAAAAVAPGQRDPNSPGWESLDNINLLKNFQIDVFVVNDNPANRTVETLEFQQVRQAVKGNKWGAWFKNDLEIFPGAAFTWNGAMHTEGSVFLGNAPNLNLISAYASCLYPDATASEITLAGDINSAGNRFQGQFVVGEVGRETQNSGGITNGYGSPKTPVVDWNNGTLTSHGSVNMSENNDSVVEGTSLISNVALDPVQIFTADISVHRKAPSSTTWTRWADWAKSPLQQNKRVLNDPNSNVPFLDDLYRADNRYGPKPSYTSNLRLSNANGSTGVKVGTAIPDTQPGLVDPVAGLDGYWERQAIREGLRIIGGERLELGNPTIWKGVGTANSREMDPLYPYDRTLSYTTPTNSTLRNDQSIRLHRLSLRDNLSAVQSMAVYHAKGTNAGSFPLMCMSMTVHPGTQATKDRSTSFNDVTINGTTASDIDFFNGFGTNGWEYGPPLANEASFETAYNNANSGLKKALQNLAHFAGDPLGGAPSFTPVQDEHIHPYPTMSMWGDFSHLRRLLDIGGAYNTLSPADQSYLHTAACTLGMLASNIDKINNFSLSATDLSDLALAIDSSSIPNVGDQLIPTTASFSDTFVLPTSPHAYISTLQTTADKSGSTASQKRMAQLARMLHLKYQIERDRKYGFHNASASALLTTDLYPVQAGPHTISGSGATAQTIPALSSVRIGKGITPAYFGLTMPLDQATEKKFLQLAAVTGGIDIPASATATPPSRNTGNPQFPSLFYLFPSVAHDHLGVGTGLTVQPAGELYIDDGVNVDAIPAANDKYVQTQNNGFIYNSFANSEIGAIALDPKPTANWISPLETSVTNRPNVIKVSGADRAVLFLDKGLMNGRELINTRALDIDLDLATGRTVVASDTATTWLAPNSPTATGGIVYAFREDARREDAIVRPFRGYNPTVSQAARDTAARTAWNTCSANITAATCLMQFNFDAGNPTASPYRGPYSEAFDPPIRRETGVNDTFISPKPVDYFADPMRRPHGFRLSNGANLTRRPPGATTAFTAGITAGLSFISDNVVFIKGDFNLHNSSGGAAREEFNELLPNAADGSITSNDFYKNRTNRSTLFANPASNNDTWRPSEVVGDAVTILSNRFVDGAIADAFIMPRPSTQAGGASSYQNYLRPRGQGKGDNGTPTDTTDDDFKTLPVSIKNPSLFRENPYDGYDPVFNNPLPSSTPPVRYNFTGDSPASPVKIWRDGEFKGERESITGDLMTLSDGNLENLRVNDRIAASTTTINALIVTGVVPSRGQQTNGGLHNLPRFLEHWDINNVFMRISGGFYQLNFSTSAASPFDEKPNVWEPTTAAPTGIERITYYGSPRRIWGYDVALQFAPAGPVSNRFITIGSPRSEYYQEVPADDPYMRNLQCAMKDNAYIVKNRTVTCP